MHDETIPPFPVPLIPPPLTPIQKELFDGPVYMGGKANPYNFLLACSRGIFPWPENDRVMIWFSPDPRGILFFKDLHIGKSLKKILRKRKFHVVFNQNFSTVVKHCAFHSKRNETWITSRMLQCYCDLFRLKHAYSVEVYEQNQLAGGLFGICYGDYFSGESMFYHRSNASKIALISLVKHLQGRGIHWLDTQMTTPVIASLGGIQIPRVRFLQMLSETDFSTSREMVLESS